MSVFDRQQQLTEVIVNCPRECSVQGAMQQYMEDRLLHQNLRSTN